MSDAQSAATDVKVGMVLRRKPLTALALSVLAAAAGSVITDAVIAMIARAAGAWHAFQPLTPGAFVPLTLVGLIIGAAAWQVVRLKAQDPNKLLRRLVPIVLVVSLIPDVAVGASHGEPGTSWGAVAALMFMHVGVAAVAIVTFRRLMPLR